MNKQTVLWTTLPYARRSSPTGEMLHLSVVLAPRLWSDETVSFHTLDRFPDWLDLPQKMANATFTVEFENGLRFAATRAPLEPDQTDELDSTLWRALFNASTIVIPYKFPAITKKPKSYSARAIAEFLQKLYTRVGTEPRFGAGGEYPSLGALAGDDALCAIESNVHRSARLARQNREANARAAEQEARDAEFERRKKEFIDWIATRNTLTDEEQARLEEERKQEQSKSAPLPSGGATYEPGRPPFVDLDDPAPQHPSLPSPPSECELVPPLDRWAETFDNFRRFHQRSPQNVVPLTQDELIFKLTHGGLTPEELAQLIDFHRAIALLSDYPRLMRRLGLVVDLKFPRTPQIPPFGNLRVVVAWNSTSPTLNYSMRTLYQLDFGFRAAPQTTALSRGLIHLNNAGYVTSQVDLDGAAFKLSQLAGDIRDALTDPDAAPTSSLPALRSGGLALLQPDPAGVLKVKFDRSKGLNDLVNAAQASVGAATGSIQNNPHPQDLDVVGAETLLRGYRVDVFDDKKGRWLSLHRRRGSYHFGNTGAELPNLEDEGFSKLSVTSDTSDVNADLFVQETLAVWQGWSLAAPQPGKAIAVPAERGEGNQVAEGGEPDLQDSDTNLPGTQFGLRATFSPKPGSLPRLRFGHSYRFRVRTVDLAGNSMRPDADDAQPVIAEATAPTVYRRFEPVSQPFLVPRKTFDLSDGESLERLVIRTRGASTTETAERHVVPPKTAQFTAELHKMFDGTTQLKRDQVGYDLAKREAKALEEVSAGTDITVPYLPDPIARGAVLLGLPGLGETAVIADTNKLPFSGSYPDLKSFRLILMNGSNLPRWDPVARTLTVFLQAGDIARVRLSSFVNADDLRLLGVWEWLQSQNPADLTALQQRAQDGRHWMLTPYRTLTLVHAVARPLSAPKFTLLNSNRGTVGQSVSSVSGEILVDRKSTAQVDLLAAWKDRIDDIAADGPGVEEHNATVGTVKIPFTDNPISQDLGLLKASTGPVSFVLGHELGDYKYHHVTYRATATTRFRDYFVGEIKNGLTITREMEDTDAVSLHIAASARPAAPQIAYIVPMFQWEFPELGPSEHSDERNRLGGGLRVYLQRPWFSSGDGELLGVVFMQAQRFRELSPLALPRVTQWARDPLWKTSHIPPEQPEYGHFKEFVYPPEDLPQEGWVLDEMSEPVQVVAYPVEYDVERRLWFSDVVLNLDNAYFPFVRLALVRCQPHALRGVELSRVALADFIQLAPDRFLSVHHVFEHEGMNQLFVTLRGNAYDARNADDEREVHISVQTPIPDESGDLAWEDVDNVEVRRDDFHSSLWQGTVRYPLSAERARLVITEIEKLSSNSSRIIYADIVPTTPIE